MVVNGNGEPLVVYRRDDENFTVFDINKTQKTDAGFLGKGFYFYGDKAEAEGPAKGYGENLRAFYLKAENPYFISQEEVNDLVNANDKTKSAEFVERLKEEGYDSVYWNGDLRQEWMVFEPTQIKSATDNIGTFDRNNPDIRYSLRKQVNPIIDDAEEYLRYQEVLNNNEYEVKHNAELERQAAKRIASLGGMDNVIKMILDGDLTPGSDVNTMIFRTVFTSPEFKKLSVDDRAELSDILKKKIDIAYAEGGTETGRALAARRLGILNVNDFKSIQALWLKNNL